MPGTVSCTADMRPLTAYRLPCFADPRLGEPRLPCVWLTGASSSRGYGGQAGDRTTEDRDT